MTTVLKASFAGAVSSGCIRDEVASARVSWTRREFDPECMAWNERKDIGLAFVGNDYTDAASSQNNSQPERLIREYEKRGPKFLASLNGIFAGVLIDHRDETLTLFNDRYGLGRLYYHEQPTGFYFATHARALLQILPHLRQVDQRGLAEFFSVGCVLQNRSLFRGVSLLPPASRWTFHRDGRVQKQRYFDPSSWEQQEPLTSDDYIAHLTDVFRRVVPRYVSTSQGVAMSLTGGLDSRIILAWAKAEPQTFPCYTFGGPYRDCADVRIARRLANISSQPHKTLRIGEDFFDEFPSLAEKSVRWTDGAMDVSGAVELYANRLALEISPVRITGNYGSEILRSYVAFRPRVLDLKLFTPEFRMRLEEAAMTYRAEATGNRLSFIAFKQVPWHHFGRFAAERSTLTPRSPFLDNEIVALAYRAPQLLAGSARPALQLISSGNPSLDSIATDRALRSRSIPLLERFGNRWQEFTAKAEYAFDYGMPVWLAQADRVLKPLHLERYFLGRHKFYHFRVWYRDQLAPALKNGAFDLTDQSSCYIEGTAAKLVREHTSGRSNRTLELHKLLSVQLIDRLVTDRACHS